MWNVVDLLIKTCIHMYTILIWLILFGQRFIYYLKEIGLKSWKQIPADLFWSHASHASKDTHDQNGLLESMMG